MSLQTYREQVRRAVEIILSVLPKLLRDRLVYWRRRYPTTPLTDLPDPVRREVKHILSKAATAQAQEAAQSTSAPRPEPHTPPPRPDSVRLSDPSHLTSVLGTDTATGREVTISQRDKAHATWIIGASGTGKTTIVATMVLSDIRNGLGICLIEPHGDLTQTVIAGIPEHRLKDVVYLDVEDYEYQFGLNLFACPQPKTIKTMAATASVVSHTFEKIWGSTGTETPRLMQNLRALTRTLLENNPHATFGEIPLLYSNPLVRAQMLRNVTNPQVLQFWEDFARKSPRERDLYTESTLNRVGAFLDEPMIRNIIAQSKTTINFRSIMDTGKILLIKLSPQFEEASRLIGSIVIGQLLMAAFSRADVPEGRRRQFNLYCDEFSRFSTSDFATLISESRKFSISTIFSHQALGQLDAANRAAVAAAGNLIVFRVSGEDVKALARNFDTTPTQEVIGVEPIRAPVADIIGHLVRRGHTNPTVATFVAEYLLPLEGLLRKVGGLHVPFEFGCMLFRNYDVINGRTLLNDCLSEAMRTGRADVFIHPLALLVLGGAADDGVTHVFYAHKKFTFLPTPEFQGFERTANRFGRPEFLHNHQAVEALLRKKLARKRVWDDVFDSRIVTPGPSFLRMLRSLRETMEILAREPVLVDTGQYQPKYRNRTYQDMENKVANFLSSHQPNFQAKVKLLTGEYVIRTRPAPEVLTGEALAERIQAIKRQMRRFGYTRHYRAVEAEIRQRQERYRGITGTTNGQTRPSPPNAAPEGNGVPSAFFPEALEDLSCPCLFLPWYAKRHPGRHGRAPSPVRRHVSLGSRTALRWAGPLGDTRRSTWPVAARVWAARFTAIRALLTQPKGHPVCGS